MSVTTSLARQGARVFVSNLPWTVGTTELRTFGASFGRLSHATVVFDKNTGLSKGYGFLVFADKDGADGLLRPGNTTHFLEGNYITCASAHTSNN